MNPTREYACICARDHRTYRVVQLPATPVRDLTCDHVHKLTGETCGAPIIWASVLPPVEELQERRVALVRSRMLDDGALVDSIADRVLDRISVSCPECGVTVTGYETEILDVTLGPNAALFGAEPDLFQRHAPGLTRLIPCGHTIPD